MDINNIIKHKIDVFKSEVIYDFFIVLLGEISQTYVGDKYVLPKKKEHFSYCFDETISIFNKMGVKLKIDMETFNWAYDFFDVAFYSVRKERGLIKDIEKRLDMISIHNKNTSSKYMEVYSLFS